MPVSSVGRFSSPRILGSAPRPVGRLLSVALLLATGALAEPAASPSGSKAPSASTEAAESPGTAVKDPPTIAEAIAATESAREAAPPAEPVSPPPPVVEPPAAQPAEPSAAAPPAVHEPEPVRPTGLSGHGATKTDAGKKTNFAKIEVGGKTVYEVRVARGEKSPEERARLADKAIKDAIKTESPDSVHVEISGDGAALYAGKIPVLQLSLEDAAAVGDSSLRVHADAASARLREAIRAEQKRSAIATTVFSGSIAVLIALVALYLLRKTTELTERARTWVSSHRDSIPAIRLQSLEVVGPAAMRSGVAVGIELVKWLARLGIVYLWLLLTLSLFAATRGYTEKLTGTVIQPLSGLMGRTAASLPVVAVALLAMAAIAVFVRFVDLFFAGVERGETDLAWIPSDLARPTSNVLQVGIVLSGLLFAAPIVTGDAEGVFTKAGIIALGAIGLGSAPLLASALVGIGVVFSRRIRAGDFVEFGGRSGRVRELGLLEVRLEDSQGLEVRVPQLLSLLHPTSVVGPLPRISVELCIESLSRETSELLRRAAASVGDRPLVEVVSVDREEVKYRVSVVSTRNDARTALFFALGDALRDAGVALSSRTSGARVA